MSNTLSLNIPRRTNRFNTAQPTGNTQIEGGDNSKANTPLTLNTKTRSNFTTPANNVLKFQNNRLTVGTMNAGNITIGKPKVQYQMKTSGIKSKFETSADDKLPKNNAMGLNSDLSDLDGQSTINDRKLRNKSHEFELFYHDSRVSNEPLYIDMSAIPGAKEGDLAVLKTYNNENTKRTEPSSNTSSPIIKEYDSQSAQYKSSKRLKNKLDNNRKTHNDKKIYFIVKDFDHNIKRRSTNQHISMLYGDLQKTIDIPNKSTVWIKLKDKQESQVDLVELNVKDCLVNRGDMWLIMNKIHDTCVFNHQKLTFVDSLRVSVSGVYSNGKKLLSGYIGDETKIIIRSESARFIFIIQITEEMWHFEEIGEIMFHKVVNSLFPKIIKAWKKIGTHHNITIAFSASVDISNSSFNEAKPGQRHLNSKDYYRIVVDQVNIAHWRTIMETLRKEFMKFKKDLLNVHSEYDDLTKIQGKLSPTVKTNLLESINLAMTLMLNPFRQRDLRHTTVHVIIISPGTGLFDVDYDLLKLTTKKLLSLEVTIDIICLSSPPLHIVPLFRYRDYSNTLRYSIPSWLSISFWEEKHKNYGNWQPSCKIYDLQMMGLSETEVKQGLSIDPLTPISHVKTLNEFIQKYDKNVFSNDIWNNSQTRKFSFSSDFKGPVDELYKVSHDSNQNKSKFMWQLPTSSNPTMDDVSTPHVFADSYKHMENNSGNYLKTQTSIDSLYHAVSARNRFLHPKISEIAHRVVSSLFTKQVPVAREEEQFGNSEADVNRDRDFILSKPKTPTADADILSISNNEGVFTNRPKPLGMNIMNDTDSRAETETLAKSMIQGGKSNLLLTKKRDLEKTMGFDSWLEIENPSTPFDAELATELIPGRWKDVYPRGVPKRYSKWRSFTTPADLPVTTSLFPNIQDFEELFELRNHSVTLNPEAFLKTPTTFELLRKLIYVRLICGFQICTSNRIKKLEKSDENDSKVGSMILKMHDFMGKVIYLALDDEIHRIVCREDHVIEIRQYNKKETQQKIDTVGSYLPMIKTRYENDYRVSDVDPLNSRRYKSNWNQVDQYLAGYEDDIAEENKKRFKSKFVVLSSEIPESTFSIFAKDTLNEEEIRLEGLRKLISVIHRSTAHDPSEKTNIRKGEILPEIFFYTGSLKQFIEDQEDSLLQKLSTDREIGETYKLQFTRDTDINKISHELQCGKNKIDLVNRRWHWNKYQHCFIGSLLVNWILEHFNDIETREEATLFGEKLMEKGLFVHVLSRHNFLDGHYFYQISPVFLVQENNENSIKNSSSFSSIRTKLRHRPSGASTTLSSRKSGSLAPLPTMQSIVSVDDISSVTSAITEEDDYIAKTEKPSIMLSSEILIDLDPSSISSKKELVTVHFDRVHNPLHCFHIRLEWLSTTPKLVDDLINSWSRILERYGLKLVEIPWQELCVLPTVNAFYSHVHIKLAIDPWTDEEFMHDPALVSNKFQYHTYLLEHSGFLMDNRGSSFLDSAPAKFEIVYSWGKQSFKLIQYVHKTGAYIAEIRENGELFLAPNNIHLSRVNVTSSTGSSGSSKFFLDSQKIMLQFKKTCMDYTSLKAVFVAARENYLTDDKS